VQQAAVHVRVQLLACLIDPEAGCGTSCVASALLHTCDAAALDALTAGKVD
jgi:hypothetical protein